MLVFEINLSEEKVLTSIMSTIKLLTLLGSTISELFNSDIVILSELIEELYNRATFNLLVITLYSYTFSLSNLT